jgi:hypothetical protein
MFQDADGGTRSFIFVHMNEPTKQIDISTTTDTNSSIFFQEEFSVPRTMCKLLEQGEQKVWK